jgi:hypothetical protein
LIVAAGGYLARLTFFLLSKIIQPANTNPFGAVLRPARQVVLTGFARFIFLKNGVLKAGGIK